MRSAAREVDNSEIDNLLIKRDLPTLIRFLDEAPNANPAKIYASAIIQISHPDAGIRASYGLNRWNDKLLNDLTTGANDFVDLTYFYRAFYIAKNVLDSQDVADAIRCYVADHLGQLTGVLSHPNLQKSYVTMICADFPIAPQQRVTPQPSLAVAPAAFFAYREEQRDNNRSVWQAITCGCSIV